MIFFETPGWLSQKLRIGQKIPNQRRSEPSLIGELESDKQRGPIGSGSIGFELLKT